jgi:hypothetical protein
MTTIAVGQLREQNGLHQHHETDPQRIAILTAADRLLAGTPKRSTGNLSIVQLAVEANVKYWVVAQSTPTYAITSSGWSCRPARQRRPSARRRTPRRYYNANTKRSRRTAKASNSSYRLMRR